MPDYREYLDRITLSINKIDGLYYIGARKLGIKANTLALLYALNTGKHYSQKQLGEEWLIPKTTINTIVKECAEAGYIVLTVEAHTREKYVSLTESGKAYVEEILKYIYEAEQKAMEQTIEEFSPQFVQAMECFAEHLQNEFEKRIFHDHLERNG